MYCSSCGSETDSPTCVVCGHTNATGTTNPKSTIDSVTGLALAGWLRRVGATFADGLVMVIPILIAESVVAAAAGTVDGVIAGLIVQGAYMIKMLSGPKGQTVGNRVAATRVRDAVTGLQITNIQALKRWGVVAVYGLLSLNRSIGTSIVLIIGLVDYLWPLFDKRNQTLHDKFAGTIVVLA